MKNTLSTLLFFFMFLQGTLAADYYWVGGSGAWSDTLHWSGTSGGLVNLSAIPSDTDNVIIDVNSGLLPDDTLFFDLTDHYCHNFTLDSLPHLIYFAQTTPSIITYLYISGDLNIESPTSWLTDPFFNTRQVFYPSSGQCTVTAPYSLFADFIVMGPASFHLGAKLDVANDFSCDGGDVTIYSHDYDFACGALLTQTPASNHFAYLGKSSFHFQSYMEIPLSADSAEMVVNREFVASVNIPVKVKKLIVEPLCEVNFSASFYAEEAEVNGTLRLNSINPDTIHKLVVYNSVSCYALQTDTIILNNPNQVFEFGFLTVNNYIESNSAPGANIIFNGIGSGSNITVYADTVCLDYLDLSNVTALGSAIYYAGVFSNDQGGNSGWIYSSCSQLISNVWPGDVNYDLTVDNLDMLLIGTGYQMTGNIRDSVSILYVGQPSLDWNSNFANGVNMKHGDCNGDGVIFTDDTLAITQNYGQTHPAFNGPTNQFPLSGFGSELRLDLPLSIAPSTTYSIPIVYGDILNQNDPLYGIAFSILFDTSQIDASSIQMTFPSSWLANVGESFNFWLNHPSGQTDIAITRFDQINSNGQGQIALLNFTTKASASGNTTFNIIRALALLQNQSKILLDLQPQSISISTGLSQIEQISANISIFPVPANENIHLRNNGKMSNSIIRFENNLGQTILPTINTPLLPEMNFDISSLPKGSYFLHIQIDDQIVTKRFIK